MPKEKFPFEPESSELRFSEETETLIENLIHQRGYSRADAVRVIRASQNVKDNKERRLNGPDRTEELEYNDDRLH
jgi:hypothetical protein